MQDWTTRLDQALPLTQRQRPEWASLLELTHTANEDEQLTYLRTWLFRDVLPPLQTLADENGFGEEWQGMLAAPSADAAVDASVSAWSDADEADEVNTADPAAQYRFTIASQAGSAAAAAVSAMRGSNISTSTIEAVSAAVHATRALAAHTAHASGGDAVAASEATWATIAPTSTQGARR